jgi:DNA-binding response OmpR family regulator
MRILIADDDAVSRRILEDAVAGLGHEVTVVEDGDAAWAQLGEGVYEVLISDWVMPGVDGPELCRRVRAREDAPYTFAMLVSQRGTHDDIVTGIMAGADDFIAKPFDRAEMRARLHAAERTVRLERSLAERVDELQKALDEVATLRRLLPICVYCKKIRNDQQAWDDIEEYLRLHANADTTHSICPSCYQERVRPMLDEFHRERRAAR